MTVWSFLCLGQVHVGVGSFVKCGRIETIPGKSAVEYMMSPGILEFQNYKFVQTGKVLCTVLQVFKDGSLFAAPDMQHCKLDPHPNGDYVGRIDIYESDLAPGATLPERDEAIAAYALKETQRKNAICTCGGWSVYGKDADLHGNYCDLRTL